MNAVLSFNKLFVPELFLFGRFLELLNQLLAVVFALEGSLVEAGEAKKWYCENKKLHIGNKTKPIVAELRFCWQKAELRVEKEDSVVSKFETTETERSREGVYSFGGGHAHCSAGGAVASRNSLSSPGKNRISRSSTN